MDRLTPRRLVVLAAALVVLVLVVHEVRHRGGGVAAPPEVRVTVPATAYVPAVQRGDPVPAVTAPDAITVTRADDTVHGLALTAPGAQPDDVLGVVVLIANGEGTIDLDPPPGVKIAGPRTPTSLYIEGKLDAVNAALARLRFMPPNRNATQFMGLTAFNKTLATNPRSYRLALRVT